MNNHKDGYQGADYEVKPPSQKTPSVNMTYEQAPIPRVKTTEQPTNPSRRNRSY